MKETSDPEARPGAKDVLRRFITENFLLAAGLESFKDDDSFMELGIIDSTGVLELLEFLEGEFGIKIEDEEVIPGNLDTLQRLGDFVRRKLESAGR